MTRKKWSEIHLEAEKQARSQQPPAALRAGLAAWGQLDEDTRMKLGDQFDSAIDPHELAFALGYLAAENRLDWSRDLPGRMLRQLAGLEDDSALSEEENATNTQVVLNLTLEDARTHRQLIELGAQNLPDDIKSVMVSVYDYLTDPLADPANEEGIPKLFQALMDLIERNDLNPHQVTLVLPRYGSDIRQQNTIGGVITRTAQSLGIGNLYLTSFFQSVTK